MNNLTTLTIDKTVNCPQLEKGIVCIKEEVLKNNASEIVYSSIFSTLFNRIIIGYIIFSIFFFIYALRIKTEKISVQKRIYQGLLLLAFINLTIQLLLFAVLTMPINIIIILLLWYLISYVLYLYKFVMLISPIVGLIIKRLKNAKEK